MVSCRSFPMEVQPNLIAIDKCLKLKYFEIKKKNKKEKEQATAGQTWPLRREHTQEQTIR